MADNEYVGSAMYLAWIHSGGTTVLQTDYRSFSWAPTLNFVDATAGADTYEHQLPSYGVGGDISLAMVAQSDGTALIASLDRGTKGTLLYGPSGTADNGVAYKIPAYAQGAQWNEPFDGVVELSCQFKQYAAESRGKWTSGAYA